MGGTIRGIGEASFLERPATTRPPLREAPAVEEQAPVDRERAEPLAAATVGAGRLIRTSVSLYQEDQRWLNDLAEQGRSAGVRRPTKDFVARSILRAVMELNPAIDIIGITLDDESEFVARIVSALER